MENDRNKNQMGTDRGRASDMNRSKSSGSERNSMRTHGSDHMAKGSTRSGEQNAPGRMSADQNQSRRSGLSPEDEREAREKVLRDAKKDPGLPTGAIYGHDNKIKSVPDDFQEGDEGRRK